MRGNIGVMVGLAVLCGGLAVFVSRSWLDMQANQRLSEMDQTSRPVAERTIVVADQPLRFGNPVRENLLREVSWPADAIPAGAFERITDLLDGEPRSVLSPIERNEPVLAAKVTGPGQRGTLSAVIDDGMRAVTVRVNDVAGVAGFILPDDRVDVLLTRRTESGDNVAEVILQGVRVLAVDQTADQRREDPTLAKAVTLEVGTRAAQKVALASTVGTLSLVLRRAGDSDGEVTRTVTLNDLVSPSVFAALNPKTPVVNADNPEPDAASAPGDRMRARIGVIRALERAEYTVPARLGD